MSASYRDPRQECHVATLRQHVTDSKGSKAPCIDFVATKEFTSITALRMGDVPSQHPAAVLPLFRPPALNSFFAQNFQTALNCSWSSLALRNAACARRLHLDDQPRHRKDAMTLSMSLCFCMGAVSSWP